MFMREQAKDQLDQRSSARVALSQNLAAFPDDEMRGPMGVGIPISFKRQPTADDSAAILAPEQQRRVIEYASGEAATRTSPERTTTNGRTVGAPAWIERALDALEPGVD